jgi:hypothetical protein
MNGAHKQQGQYCHLMHWIVHHEGDFTACF